VIATLESLKFCWVLVAGHSPNVLARDFLPTFVSFEMNVSIAARRPAGLPFSISIRGVVESKEPYAKTPKEFKQALRQVDPAHTASLSRTACLARRTMLAHHNVRSASA
jgi:hypothetical protein